MSDFFYKNAKIFCVTSTWFILCRNCLRSKVMSRKESDQDAAAIRWYYSKHSLIIHSATFFVTWIHLQSSWSKSTDRCNIALPYHPYLVTSWNHISIIMLITSCPPAKLTPFIPSHTSRHILSVQFLPLSTCKQALGSCTYYSTWLSALDHGLTSNLSVITIILTCTSISVSVICN